MQAISENGDLYVTKRGAYIRKGYNNNECRVRREEWPGK